MDRFALKAKEIFTAVYKKVFLINDTPHKVALGLGLGVFSGILPGTGPLAALFMAFLFRANRAAALFGSMITNTWISIVGIVLSVKMGAFLTGRQWQEVYRESEALVKNMRWDDLLAFSFLRVIWPVILGYFVFALALGMAVYIAAYAVIKIARILRSKRQTNR